MKYFMKDYKNTFNSIGKWRLIKISIPVFYTFNFVFYYSIFFSK